MAARSRQQQDGRLRCAHGRTRQGRLIEFERVANFRDLGGYRGRHGQRVRLGRLYRSAALDHMTVADAARAHRELGIRTVVDLRAIHEVPSQPRHPLYHLGVERHCAPLSNPTVEAGWESVPPYGVESYVLSIEHARSAIRGAIERLAAPDGLPAVVHCQMGKDRTGIMTALLLDLLGVDDRDISADYAASEEHLLRAIEIAGSDPAGHPGELEVQPASLLGTLAYVRKKYGGAEAYFLVAGVSAETIERLRDALLE